MFFLIKKIKGKLNALIFSLILLSTLFFLIGCSDEESSVQNKIAVQFLLKWADAEPIQNSKGINRARACQELEINNVLIKIYTIDRNLLKEVNWDCSVAGGIIEAIGSNEKLKMVFLATNQENRIIHRGEYSNVLVTPGYKTYVGTIVLKRFKTKLQSPAPEENQPKGNVTLKWEQTEGAKKYHILVAETEDFKNSVIVANATMGLEYKLTDIAPNAKYFWKIIPEDGFGGKGSDSEIWSFTSYNEPEVTIIKPLENRRITKGKKIIFMGSAYDQDEGQISAKEFIWYSNINGKFGKGSNFKVSTLSPGRHIITLKVKNKKNIEGKKSIRLIIDAPPKITLITPKMNEKLIYRETHEFTALVKDKEDKKINSKNIQWISDRNGLIGKGFKFKTKILKKGAHHIRIKAIDSNKGRAELGFNIMVIPDPQLSEQLIAHYPFENNAADESGMAKKGIVHGAQLIQNRFNAANSAYYFDGISSYIDVTFPRLRATAFSFCAWIAPEKKKTATKTHQIFFGGRTRGFGPTYSLVQMGTVWNNSSIVFAHFEGNSSVNRVILEKEMDINDEKWHFFCVTSDEDNAKLYIDGELVQEIIQGTTGMLSKFAVIGGFSEFSYGKGVAKNFKGKVDDVRIYAKALSEETIQKLFKLKF